MLHVCVPMCLCLCVQAVWRAEPVDAGVHLSLTSPDGDQGYPGELQVSLTYTLKESKTLLQEIIFLFADRQKDVLY